MSKFIPGSVRELFVEAVDRLPRPLDRDVIARTFALIEDDAALMDRYRKACEEYGYWSVK